MKSRGKTFNWRSYIFYVFIYLNNYIFIYFIYSYFIFYIFILYINILSEFL